MTWLFHRGQQGGGISSCMCACVICCGRVCVCVCVGTLYRKRHTHTHSTDHMGRLSLYADSSSSEHYQDCLAFTPSQKPVRNVVMAKRLLNHSPSCVISHHALCSLSFCFLLGIFGSLSGLLFASSLSLSVICQGLSANCSTALLTDVFAFDSMFKETEYFSWLRSFHRMCVLQSGV